MIEEEEYPSCSMCGKNTIKKISCLYGLFIETKHPDGVCDSCGYFYWRQDRPLVVQEPLKEEVPVVHNAERSLHQELFKRIAIVTSDPPKLSPNLAALRDEIRSASRNRGKGHKRYRG